MVKTVSGYVSRFGLVVYKRIAYLRQQNESPVIPATAPAIAK
ncbi:hypothetical protein [Nostoc sp. NZL]|nr:hypothetical protein [Nostoc sp. NZL]